MALTMLKPWPRLALPLTPRCSARSGGVWPRSSGLQQVPQQSAVFEGENPWECTTNTGGFHKRGYPNEKSNSWMFFWMENPIKDQLCFFLGGKLMIRQDNTRAVLWHNCKNRIWQKENTNKKEMTESAISLQRPLTSCT